MNDRYYFIFQLTFVKNNEERIEITSSFGYTQFEALEEVIKYYKEYHSGWLLKNMECISGKGQWNELYEPVYPFLQSDENIYSAYVRDTVREKTLFYFSFKEKKDLEERAEHFIKQYLLFHPQAALKFNYLTRTDGKDTYFPEKTYFWNDFFDNQEV